MNSAPRSQLTPRSPTLPRSPITPLSHALNNEIEKRITRSQANKEESTPTQQPRNEKQDTPTQFITKTTHNTQTPIIQKTQTFTVQNPQTPTMQNTQTTDMNAIQIQQLIATSIPEFSGANNPERHNNLTRFLAAADDISDALQTQNEKNIFNRLIKLKLTNEAFNRVNNRNLKTYTEIRKLLAEMYTETYTLEELEKQLTNTKQTYGESIRNYGFRLIDALEKYKNSYRIKYDIQNIDPTYQSHLETNSIKTFKRGLNNTILKDKITTSTTTDLYQIITETEAIEKMLLDTDNQTDNNTSTYTNFTSIQNTQITPQIICNYCQKPNHTYDKCQTRILNEQSTQPQHYQKQNYQPQPFNKPTLYCSFCKTTKGHTFAQCRSKYQQQPENNKNYYPNNKPTYNNYSPTKRYNQNQNSYSRYQSPNNNHQQQYYSPRQNTNYQNENPQTANGNEKPQDKQTKKLYSEQDLADMLQNMKINRLYTEQEPQAQYSNQGNSNGSNQS